MKYWSTKPLIAVIALIGAFSLGISGALVYSSLTSAQENSSENSSSIMYFLNSESGNLEKSGDNTYLLTLNQTSTSIIWFTDRPQRLADTVSTSTFVDSWQKLGFTEDPPNITMTLESLEPASPEVSVVATMTNPTYDVYSGIFTAELTIILEEISLKMADNSISSKQLPLQYFLKTSLRFHCSLITQVTLTKMANLCCALTISVKKTRDALLFQVIKCAHCVKKTQNANET